MGKICNANFKTTSKFLKNYHKLLDHTNNKQCVLKNVIFPFEDIAMDLYEDNKYMHWGSNQTNVAIAAFVTAQAILKLYGEMKLLGERVLYVDTNDWVGTRAINENLNMMKEMWKGIGNSLFKNEVSFLY